MELQDPRNVAEAKTVLENSYNKVGHPLAYASASTIHRFFGGVLPLKYINDFLAKQTVYSVHRENRKKARTYAPMKAYFPRALLQMDLIDVSGLAKENDKITFLLIILVTFTRKSWVKTLHSKSASEVLKAFKSIHAEINEKVFAICANKSKVCDIYKQDHS